MTTFQSFEISTNNEPLMGQGRESDSNMRSAIPKMSMILLVLGVMSVVVLLANNNNDRLGLSSKMMDTQQDSTYRPPLPKPRIRKCTGGEYRVGTKCVRCPKGSSCNGKSKQKCRSGEYQDCIGQSTCLKVPCGYVSNSARTELVSCAAGTYQPVIGGSKCLLAPVGTFTDVKGSCEYKKCGYGYYQQNAGQKKCDPSPCGSYVSTLKCKSPQKCSQGTYQPTKGERGCITIPQGYVATKNRCNIIRCKPGTYRSSSTPYKCITVPCGHYSGYGAPKPTLCGTGYYQPSRGQSSCVKIPIGKVVSKDRCSCKFCKQGYYPGAYGRICKPCQPGSYQPRPNSKCVPCPCGTYSTGTGAYGKCALCPAGRYQSNVGQQSCRKIPKNYYSPAGKCKVLPCPYGRKIPGCLRRPRPKQSKSKESKGHSRGSKSSGSKKKTKKNRKCKGKSGRGGYEKIESVGIKKSVGYGGANACEKACRGDDECKCYELISNVCYVSGKKLRWRSNKYGYGSGGRKVVSGYCYSKGGYVEDDEDEDDVE